MIYSAPSPVSLHSLRIGGEMLIFAKVYLFLVGIAFAIVAGSYPREKAATAGISMVFSLGAFAALWGLL